jgi:hypothetical protein
MVFRAAIRFAAGETPQYYYVSDGRGVSFSPPPKPR